MTDLIKLPSGDWVIEKMAIWAPDDCPIHPLAESPLALGCRTRAERLAILQVMSASKEMLAAIAALLALEIKYDPEDDPEQHRAWERARTAYARATGVAVDP